MAYTTRTTPVGRLVIFGSPSPGQGHDLPSPVPVVEARPARRPIARVASQDWTVRSSADHGVTRSSSVRRKLDDEVFAPVRDRLSYVSGDFTDGRTYTTSHRRSRRDDAGVFTSYPAISYSARSLASDPGRLTKTGRVVWRNRSATTLHPHCTRD